MATKNILVTGGAGLIGSRLCKKLLENELYNVICIDDLSTGSRYNIMSLHDHPCFIFIKKDIRDLTESNILNLFTEIPILRRGVADSKPDYIFHLACPASPFHYQKNPFDTIQICLQGTANVLEIAKKVKARVVLASTSEIYGEPLEHPQNEDYNGNTSTTGPRSPYDEGKRGMEAMAMAHFRQYATNIGIARIFNTYGPGMLPDDKRVVSNFIVNTLRGKPIEIYGNGEQTRSFCYVDDTVNGLIKLMESNIQGPINIGNPTEITIRQLADIVIKHTNAYPQIRYVDLPTDDPKKRCPDITRAQVLLNWNPEVDLDEGIKKTIKYLSKMLNRVY